MILMMKITIWKTDSWSLQKVFLKNVDTVVNQAVDTVHTDFQSFRNFNLAPRQTRRMRNRKID
jgi:hypothetical protein